jgi:hypothetical protein
LEVPQTFLQRTVQHLNKYVQGCATELVFNFDEIGILDWEDRKTRNIVAQVTIHDQMIHHGISGNVTHISVIACLFPTGKSLLPYIITLQDFSSVQQQLKQPSVGFGMHLVLKSDLKPYINVEKFFDSIRIVILSNLGELLALDEFAGEMAVLLMDNCSSHIDSDVIGLLTEGRVRVTIFALHTIQIFQVFDVTFSGALKRHPRYELAFGDEKTAVRS